MIIKDDINHIIQEEILPLKRDIKEIKTDMRRCFMQILNHP